MFVIEGHLVLKSPIQDGQAQTNQAGGKCPLDNSSVYEALTGRFTTHAVAANYQGNTEKRQRVVTVVG
jgi:hypothetical protein